MQEEKFKNTSRLDENEVAIFQKLATKTTNLLISIVFAILFVGLGIGLCFIDVALGVIMIVCGLLGGFVLLPYLMKDMLKKQNAATFGGKKFLNTYSFFEDYVAITTESTKIDNNNYEEVASEKLYYEDVYKAVLFRDHLYLFINAQQSFIVDYKGMTKGTIAEVIDFIKTKNIKVVDKTTK